MEFGEFGVADVSSGIMGRKISIKNCPKHHLDPNLAPTSIFARKKSTFSVVENLVDHIKTHLSK